MKKNLMVLLLGVVFVSLTAQAMPDVVRMVTLKPQSVFLPKGFDSNDNVQLVVYGKFHDICEKIAPTNFTIDRVNHKIYVQPKAYATKMCAAMYVNNPYTLVLNLGNLATGTYDVFTMDESRSMTSVGQLPIADAKGSVGPDSSIYALIESVQFQKTSDPATIHAILKGRHQNSCLSLSDVKVNLTAGRVFDVLPVLTARTSNCAPSNTPFEVTVTISQVPVEPTLINVRSMGGQSFETVIDRDQIPLP